MFRSRNSHQAQGVSQNGTNGIDQIESGRRRIGIVNQNTMAIIVTMKLSSKILQIKNHPMRLMILRGTDDRFRVTRQLLNQGQLLRQIQAGVLDLVSGRSETPASAALRLMLQTRA